MHTPYPGGAGSITLPIAVEARMMYAADRAQIVEMIGATVAALAHVMHDACSIRTARALLDDCALITVALERLRAQRAPFLRGVIRLDHLRPLGR
jgi:hypothetical protein